MKVAHFFIQEPLAAFSSPEHDAEEQSCALRPPDRRGAHRATLYKSTQDLDLLLNRKDVPFGLPFPRGRPKMLFRPRRQLTLTAGLTTGPNSYFLTAYWWAANHGFHLSGYDPSAHSRTGGFRFYSELIDLLPPRKDARRRIAGTCQSTRI